jgi:hypothetical protein
LKIFPPTKIFTKDTYGNGSQAKVIYYFSQNKLLMVELCPSMSSPKLEKGFRKRNWILTRRNSTNNVFSVKLTTQKTDSLRMYFSSVISTMRMGEKRNAYRLLVGKPERKRPLGRPRRRWVDNIRMDLGEVGWGDVDWIGLTKDRNRWRALVNSVLNLRVP